MRRTLIGQVSLILITILTITSCGNKVFTPEELDPTEYLGIYTVEKDGNINYTKESAKFAIEFDDVEETLKLKMYQVKFDEKMPVTLNIVAKSLPYIENSDTSIVSVENVVPTVGGVPMGAYALQNLNVKVTDKSLYVDFACKGSKVIYTGKK